VCSSDLVAVAQNYPPPPYYSSAPPSAVSQEQLPPPVGAQDQRYYQPPIQGGQPQRVLPYPDEEEASMPPPGFAAPNGGPPPAYGHQLDQQQMQRQQVQQGPPQPAPSGRYEEGAIRPPGVVGIAPGNAPGYAPGPAPAQGAAPRAAPPAGTAALPPEDQPEQGQPKELPANLKKQLVEYNTREPPGTIIIDTPHTYLYLVLGHGQAIRYGIGVGREGFTWAGTERISKMKEWPDWFPPAEMIERQPYLPRMMAGGEGNPLGARALYLGHTLYRIHGTNQPSTIGQTVSSGCIRLLNQDIEDLFSRVQVGTRVVVLPGSSPDTVANTGAPPAAGGLPPAQGAHPAPGNIEPERGGTAVSGSPLPAMR
jgi:lipoprotein-anchoring transpeptidase ErfK/SrfK